MTDKIEEILSHVQAGGNVDIKDVNIDNSIKNQILILNKPDIIFNQTKFSQVLEAFLKESNELDREETTEIIDVETFKRNMPLKNELNNVSIDYYEQVINIELQQYFSDVSVFLQNPRNENFLNKYMRIAKDLTNNYIANKQHYRNIMLHMQYVKNDMLKKFGEEIEDDFEDYITIFLNHMYFFCEYGIRVKGEINDNTK